MIHHRHISRATRVDLHRSASNCENGAMAESEARDTRMGLALVTNN